MIQNTEATYLETVYFLKRHLCYGTVMVIAHNIAHISGSNIKQLMDNDRKSSNVQAAMSVFSYELLTKGQLCERTEGKTI